MIMDRAKVKDTDVTGKEGEEISEIAKKSDISNTSAVYSKRRVIKKKTKADGSQISFGQKSSKYRSTPITKAPISA